MCPSGRRAPSRLWFSREVWLNTDMFQAGQSPACPLCGAPSVLFAAGTVPEAAYFAERSYRVAAGARSHLAVWRCQSCGHGFSPLKVSAATLEGWYTGSQLDTTYRNGQVARQRTADRLLRRLEQTVTPGRLFDVGAGAGFLVRVAMDRGWQAEGLEPQSSAVRYGRVHLGVPMLEGTASLLPTLPASSRDVVTLLDVIEHVVSPGALLAGVAHVLVRGGHLVLTTPRWDSWVARLLGTHWYAMFPAHVHFFTRRSLTRSLTLAGFRVVRLGVHWRYLDAAYLWQRVWASLGRQAAVGSGVFSHLAVPICLGDEFEVTAELR